jgi:hypothetical protein
MTKSVIRDADQTVASSAMSAVPLKAETDSQPTTTPRAIIFQWSNRATNSHIAA